MPGPGRDDAGRLARLRSDRRLQRGLEVEVARLEARRVRIRDVRGEHLLALGPEGQRLGVKLDHPGEWVRHGDPPKVLRLRADYVDELRYGRPDKEAFRCRVPAVRARACA